MLIQATGARPRVDFLPFGLRSPRGGIVTTIDGQVLGEDGPIPGLYAVGDCADVLDEGGWRFGGHWTQALNDPARVAAHLTGQMRPATIEASEVFSTQFSLLGHEITLVGGDPRASTRSTRRPAADGCGVGTFPDRTAIPSGRAAWRRFPAGDLQSTQGAAPALVRRRPHEVAAARQPL